MIALLRTVALVLVAFSWPGLMETVGEEALPRVGAAELQGNWVFGEEASWFLHLFHAKARTLFAI